MPKSAAPATAVDLKDHIANFKKWLATDTERAAAWQKEREERLAWYQQYLARNKVATLSLDDFSTLVKELWAVNIWHDKDYKVNKVIEDNGLDKLRAALDNLLYGGAAVEQRWDTFRTVIKGLGPSSLSEILIFFDPQQYALVNLKPYEVLPRIGYTIDPVKDGRSYKKAVNQLGQIKALLVENGVADADFILTDFFIAYLFYEVLDLRGRRDVPITAPSPPVSPEIQTREIAAGELVVDSHESAEAILLMLGNLLGYDTYTPDSSRTYNSQKLGDIATLEDLPPFTSEKIMDSIRNVDVVWPKEEWPEYFFEVEHTTGVTPGLLRIYQAQKINAKFFIIGPKDVLKKFEREVEKAPFNSIKEKYRFRSYEALRGMYLTASQFRKTSDDFLG